MKKKKLSTNEIYSYALYLYKKGKLTEEKRSMLFYMLMEASAKDKTTKDIYKFIKEFKGVTLDELIDLAINLEHEKLIEELLKLAKGKNKEKLLEAIINLNTLNQDNKELNDETLYKYIVSRDKPLSELEVFINALIEYSIKNKNGERLFCLADKGILKVEEFTSLAIKIGHPKTLYLAVVSLKDSDKERLLKALINTKSGMYIYFTAMFMDNPLMDILEDGIINCEEPEYMYEFARDIEGANVEKIVNKLIDYQNIELLEKCMSLGININQKIQIARLIKETANQNKKTRK